MQQQNSPVHLVRTRLFVGGGWLFGVRAANLFIVLAGSAVTARLLTPEALGTFFLIMNFANVAAMIAQLGLAQAAIRAIAEALGTGGESRVRYLAKCLFGYAILSTAIVSIIISGGLADWFAAHVFRARLMLGLGGMIAMLAASITFFQIATAIFCGFHELRIASIVGLVGPIVGLVILLSWYVFFGMADVRTILAFAVFASFSSLGVACYALWGRLGEFPRGPNEEGLNLMSHAWSFWLVNLTLYLMRHVDVWIAASFLSASEIAIYCTATRLMTVVGFPATLFNTVVTPTIVEFNVQNKRELLQQMLRTTTTLASLPAVVITILLLSWGRPILGAVYGPVYQEGYTLLCICCLGTLFHVLKGPCGLLMLMTGHQWIVLRLSLVAAVCNVVSVSLAIGPFGLVGVVTSVMIVNVSYGIAAMLCARSKLGVWTYATLSTQGIRQFLHQ